MSRSVSQIVVKRAALGFRCGVTLLIVLPIPSHAARISSSSRNIIVEWNDAALRGVKDSRLPAPEVARALAVINTCMYDAWAAYDNIAYGTQLKDILRRPASEGSPNNKEEAVSYAAYTALTDVLPVDTRAVYTPLLRRLGFDPTTEVLDLTKASGIGKVACSAVLEYRHHYKSNQLGDLSPGPYTDWTKYVARNKPTAIPVGSLPADADHWQPLTYVNGAGERVTQSFAGAQWGLVLPFALATGNQYRNLVSSFGPARSGSPAYVRQVDETIALSAGLSDREKMISEFWSDGVYTEQPPGHWMRIAEWVSERDHHSLDDDVKFFFVLSNALMDAGIAAWDAKAAYDSVRPITAVTALYRGKTIQAWGGPGNGTISMDGAHWMPYQETDSPTPPFPEFVSGHSAYSAAAAEILREWTGSDLYGGSVMLASGSSKIEPGVTPRQPVTLLWPTFTAAAEEAGMSRRYGGIHFQAGDEAGRLLGKTVAQDAWSTAQGYWEGKPKKTRLLTAVNAE